MLKILKTLFNKEETKECVFIHIPKCGGSSFIGLLKDSVKLNKEKTNTATHLIRKVGNTTIEHVDFSTIYRKFRKPQIFNNAINTNYLDKELFMLVRNPIDRLYSEFNFQYHILNGKNGNPNDAIISSLKKMPNCFEEYIANKETQNYQCKFLIGRPIADPNPLLQSEFDTIIETIEHLNIHCGTTESFDFFLSKFVRISKIQLKKKFILRKRTPKHFKGEISERTKKKIREKNKFDFMLYEYIKSNNKTNQKKEYKVQETDEFIV